MLRMAYFREMSVSLRMAFESVRMSFKDIERKIRQFLHDLKVEDDINVFEKLQAFVRSGEQDPLLAEFFRNISTKQLTEIRKNVNHFLASLRDMLSGTFRPGLSRLLCLSSLISRYMLADIDNSAESAKPGQDLGREVDHLVETAVSLIDALVARTVSKQIEMNNFYVFLYRSRLKTLSPKKVSEYEDVFFDSQRLDMHLLLKTLKGKESLYMRDLAGCLSSIKLAKVEESNIKESFLGQRLGCLDLEQELAGLERGVEDLVLEASQSNLLEEEESCQGITSSLEEDVGYHGLWARGEAQEVILSVVLEPGTDL